jgi:tRNA-dihydrouridine synthase 1
MVRRCSAGIKVPLTVKMRVFDSIERTVSFAKMLQDAGASLLTVHGRTRSCTHHEGDCNWAAIRAVKDAVDIPVIANGGMIRGRADVDRCMAETG